MAIRATVTNASGDTLWTLRTPDVHVMEQVMVKIMDQELPLPMPIPFGPQPYVDYHPDFGIVVSAGLASELDNLNQNGEIQIRVRANVAPEAPTGQDRQLLIQSLRVAQDNAPGVMKQAYQSQIEHLHMPQAKAPWTEVEIDDSGFIWLLMPLPSLMAASDDTTRSFRIISPEGEYLGITTRPKGGAQSLAYGKILLQTTDPETSEHLLMVYRIHPAVEGLEYP